MTSAPLPLPLRARRSPGERHLPRRALVACLLAATALASLAARAEVWGYVDETGRVHVASEQVDARYRLFFRGNLPAAPQPAPAVEESTPPPPPPVAPPEPASPVRLPAEEARFRSMIDEHAARQDVDAALVRAIIAIESRFEPTAVSPKGARGLMQVMPETAARYGLVSDRQRTAEQKLLDPAVNLRIGTRYLRDLLARFANDLTLSLAAYNAGEGAVERYQRRVPPFPETIDYVRRVKALYESLRPPPPPRRPAAAPAPAPAVQAAAPDLPLLRGTRRMRTPVVAREPVQGTQAPGL